MAIRKTRGKDDARCYPLEAEEEEPILDMVRWEEAIRSGDDK